MNQEHIILIFEHYRNLPFKAQQALYRTGSGGDYVHCEIIDPQRDFIRASAWWDNGVKFKSFDKISNTDNYQAYVIPTEFSQEIHDFHVSQIGKKYDKIGLFFNMFLDKGKDFKNNWFCSELNYYELKNIAHLPLPNVAPERVTPMMLKLMIERAGYNAQILSQLLQGHNNR
jgi:hypothetical protein